LRLLQRFQLIQNLWFMLLYPSVSSRLCELCHHCVNLIGVPRKEFSIGIQRNCHLFFFA
jgi:hypothetical protein